MSDKPAYVEYHPRWYRPRISTWWWMERSSYLLFILRELSSVFVAWSVVYLLLVVHAVSQGKPFPDWARNPFFVALNAVSLLFVVFHAVTWFNLAPKAMVVRLRGKAVPGKWIAASNYAAWALVSAVVAWLVLGG
jgi:fumarate reductase subunit C